MTLTEALIMTAAGFAGGCINTLVGGGSLLTFPALLLLGYPPLTANVTNATGMLPGSFTGAFAYRRELPPRRQVIPATAAALAGAAAGALALLLLPPHLFTEAVPYLVGGGCVLVLLPVPGAARHRATRGG